MNASTDELIAALRAELQQYGGLLALLDEQQELVARQSATELMENLAGINAQVAVIRVARLERERQQRTTGESLGLAGPVTLTQVAAALPSHYHDLITTLVAESNQCLRRARQRAQQNQLLLSRSMEMMQRLIASLLDATQAATYRPDGQLDGSLTANRQLCDVVG